MIDTKNGSRSPDHYVITRARNSWFPFLLAVTALFELGSARCLALTLGEALNATNLVWTTWGTNNAFGWSVETNTTHDGVAAAAAFVLSFPSAESILETTVIGPGKLTFWWNDPSMYGSLLFSCDGSPLVSIGFNQSWEQQTIYIGAGAHTVRWTFALGAIGYDHLLGYLDEVSFTPGYSPPTIASQPLSQSQIPGCLTIFTAEAGGTPPLLWQWQISGLDIAGATRSSFSISNVLLSDLGAYTVSVSNAYGVVTSKPATLEFGSVTGWGTEHFGATVPPVDTSNIVALAAGGYFNLSLRSDGTVLAWGNDIGGQVTSARDLTNVIAVAARGANAMALSEQGAVVAWGSGEITNVPPGLTNVVAIAAGIGIAVALTSDGRVVAWNNGFDLGQTNVPTGLSNIVAVAGGFAFGLALSSDSKITGWGDWPPTPPANLTNIIAIAAGASHAMALQDNGTVICWGDNGYGQATPPKDLSNVVAIAAGDLHSLALRADGTVVAWGLNDGGITNPPAALTNAIAIAAGSRHNVALVGTPPPSTAMALAPQLTDSDFRFQYRRCVVMCIRLNTQTRSRFRYGRSYSWPRAVGKQLCCEMPARLPGNGFTESEDGRAPLCATNPTFPKPIFS